jgi:hypothetical protein
MSSMKHILWPAVLLMATTTVGFAQNKVYNSSPKYEGYDRCHDKYEHRDKCDRDHDKYGCDRDKYDHDRDYDKYGRDHDYDGYDRDHDGYHREYSENYQY